MKVNQEHAVILKLSSWDFIYKPQISCNWENSNWKFPLGFSRSDFTLRACVTRRKGASYWSHDYRLCNVDSCASSRRCDWISSRFTSSTSWLDYAVNHLCLSAVFPLILFTANMPDKVFPYTQRCVCLQVLKSLFLLPVTLHTFTMFPLNDLNCSGCSGEQSET